MDTLTKAELNLEKLRGQVYDGAGNISRKVKVIYNNRYTIYNITHICVIHVCHT